MKIAKIAAKVLGGFLVAAILIALVCVFLFWQIANSMCGTEIFQEVTSPNGKNKLVLYQRDCGATTGFATHISLIRSNADLPNTTGNVFQAPGHPDWFDIKISWEDDRHAVIEHNGKPIPYLTETKVGRVEFRYVENTSARLPQRPFPAADLLLPVSYFPSGWISEEILSLGPEEIKDSNENNPYAVYSPSPQIWAAFYAISRKDTVQDAIQGFESERSYHQTYHTNNCTPPGSEPAFVFQSQYTTNVYVGFSEHKYADGSGDPVCRMYAQYDEFLIEFYATISENGLTYQQFNDLLLVIDEIMLNHLSDDRN